MLDVHGRPWAIVLAAVLTYDAWLIRYERDSLSCHFARAARRRPAALSLSVGYLLAHLYGVLPEQGDVFQQAFKQIRKKES